MFEFAIEYGLCDVGRLLDAERGDDGMVIRDARVSNFYVMDHSRLSASDDQIMRVTHLVSLAMDVLCETHGINDISESTDG